MGDVENSEQNFLRNYQLLDLVQVNENKNTDDIVLKTKSEELDNKVQENDLDRRED